MESFSTDTALFSREEAAAAHSSRLHHEPTGAAGSTSGKAYRAPQNQSATLYPQITTLKHIQFLDAAVAASISKPAAFQEKSMACTHIRPCYI